MAPKTKFDRKNATSYTLVNRAFDDPDAHDDNAIPGVFVPVTDAKTAKQSAPQPTSQKAIDLTELEEMMDEFEAQGRRENEGEAALYGITYDDSNYDYMQHLRPIGEHPDAYFIGKDGKTMDSYRPPEVGNRMTMADLLNGKKVEEQPRTFKEHYQSQLPIQDSIAGLQPDMDPRLREVLEALEDDEYVENDDEQLFDELITGGEVKNEAEWKATLPTKRAEDLVQNKDEADWEFAFRKFKLEEKESKADSEAGDVGSDFASDFGSDDVDFGSEAEVEDEEKQDTVGTLGQNLKGAAATADKHKRKKRIGAKTDLSGYSMSSSANHRNAGLSLLDDKFELIEEAYANDSADDDVEEDAEFDMSKEREDLESIMDDFLEGYAIEGKKLYRRKQ